MFCKKCQYFPPVKKIVVYYSIHEKTQLIFAKNANTPADDLSVRLATY
jgi:hypothetical protein